MFGSLGVPEMLFILGLALLVFGPKRLPELGRTIGRALGEFRRASTDLRRSLNNELSLEEESPRRPGAAEPDRSQDSRASIAAPVPAAAAQAREAPKRETPERDAPEQDAPAAVPAPEGESEAAAEEAAAARRAE